MRMEPRCGLFTISLATVNFQIILGKSGYYGTLEKRYVILCRPSKNTKNLDAYARDNKLLDIPKCKWSRRLANNTKMFIRISKIFSEQTKRHNTKYKYGVNIPWNVKLDIKFDHVYN